MKTFIQVLYGLIEVLTEVLIVHHCSLKSPYTNSQIYSSRNICPMASRFLHRSGPCYAPVCVPVYTLGLTDRSQLIRSSACSADPADVELVSQHRIVTVVQLVDYTDVDWAGNAGDRRSTSGFAFSPGSVMIAWSSKKQPTVALSSTKAEYRGAVFATYEAILLK